MSEKIKFILISLCFCSTWGLNLRENIGFGPTPPLPANVSIVADGFSWIENICFDDNGTMYASELNRGQLLMIHNIGNEEEPEYETTLLINNDDGLIKKFLGCVVDNDRYPGFLFISGEFHNDTSMLIGVPINDPNHWDVVAYTQVGVGNGIRLHEKTGIIYTSTEGTFFPGTGSVYQIDPSQPWGGDAKVLVTDLWACDGLWIDQELDILYVGLLFSAEVWTYSLSNEMVYGIYNGLEHLKCKELFICAMDDFTLSKSNNSNIISCAWTNNTLTTFPTFSSSSSSLLLENSDDNLNEHVILSNIQNPTSVRWGSGKGGFSSSSLFISEGGGLVPQETKFRILEWKNADQYV